MKNIFRISMVMFFMASVNFTNAVTIDSPGCFEYAIDAAYAEHAHYGGTMEDMEESANWYYFACLEAGGAENMLDPVFL